MVPGTNHSYRYKTDKEPATNNRILRIRNIGAVAIIAGLTILCLYTSNSPLADSVRSIAGIRQQTPDPHVSRAQLSVHLSMAEKKTSPPTIVATVTNLHRTTNVTLLLWDTAVDDKALPLGVFQIRDLEHDFLIPPAGLDLDRIFPPPEEAFVEIGPRHAVAREIVLEGPGAQLEPGKQYEVTAKGRWRAVWQANVLDVGYGNLQKMGGGTGVMHVDFESNALIIKG